MKKRQPAKGTPPPSNERIARDIPWYPLAVVLAILVLAVYWQVGRHAFVNVDDDFYVSGNAVVLRGLTAKGVSWAFTTFHATNWHPLTWLSHMLDVTLFGPSPGWHHRMNLLYHLLNTEFLFLVLWRMTGGMWQAAFVAALFGVHPLHVESVAWVAERKDVLSTLFWLLTMGAYLRYVRRPGAGRYVPVVVLFALGLMSKPMLVTLPFVLLLLDIWPLGRLAPPGSEPAASWRSRGPALLRLVREKVPLLLLSAMSCAITYLAQSGGSAVLSIDRLPVASRISNAFVSCAVYLVQAAWPSSLAVYYPHPGTIGTDVPAWRIAGSLALFCGLSALALRQARRRPFLAVGWLWYVGTLVPVIGLVQVGGQAHADRYTYVPLIGIFIAVAWGVPSALSGRRYRRLALGACAGAALVALSAAARVQAGYWRDSVTLLSHAAAVTDRNWAALNNLGAACADLGLYPQAIGYMQESLRIAPRNPAAWNNLGLSFNRIGRYQQAVGFFQEALRLRPDFPEALNNLGVACNGLGQYRQAIDSFRDALRITPDYAEAWNNLGVSHARLGQDRQAIGYFRDALRLEPRYAKALNNLGASYGRLGEYGQAAGYFRESQRIEPGSAEVLKNLGMCYSALGRHQLAVDCFAEALRIRPDDAAARDNLAAAASKLGRSR